MTLVRAKHDETGHLAALPKDALELGMCPGWSEVEGPVPSGPKLAAFPRQESVEDTSESEPPEEDAGEQPPPETADTTSAKKNRS
jgi:hypothetical protein